MCALAVVCIAL